MFLSFGSGVAFAREPIERAIVEGRDIYHQAICSRTVTAGFARCHAHMVVNADSTPVVTAGSRSANGKSLVANATASFAPAGYSPTDLRSAYAITATGSSTTIVAVVDAYGYPQAESDLANYRAQFGLPACTTANGCFIKIDQNGGTNYPAANTSWDQEQAIDLDMVSAMCPKCRIMLVQASSASFQALGIAVATAAARGAKAISNSYGAPEAGTQTYAAYYNHPGIAVTASAGDSGYGAQFPASLPTVIAVSGTQLTKAAGTTRGWSETAWSGTGSGCSAVYSKPTWQTDKLCPRRMATDVAATASPSNPVAVYGPTGNGPNSGWLLFGGTSVSSPLIAGIFAATAMTANGGQSFWAAKSGLNKVTTGSNGSCGATYFCTAGVGYNGPTGNGTPSGTTAF